MPKKTDTKPRVLRYVYEQGENGATDEEIANALGIRLSTVSGSGRGDQMRRGWIIDSGRKRLVSTGNQATVWVMSRQGAAAMAAGETTLPPPAKNGDGKPKGTKTRAGSRLQQLKRQPAGDFSEWMVIRKRILGETIWLTRVEVMAFWNNVPDNELEMVHEEIVELREWVDNALAAIELRAHDDAIKRKIAKMEENTNGRTEAELETARGRIKVLKAKL